MDKYKETLLGIPRDRLNLLKIQSLGPKTLALARNELCVKNLEDLRRVIDDGTLSNLFGMEQ
jgi:DNA polymerase/3'-5' exonuclease PolX